MMFYFLNLKMNLWCVLDGLCNWNLLRLHWIEYFRDLQYFVLKIKLCFVYRDAFVHELDLSEKIMLHLRFFFQYIYRDLLRLVSGICFLFS